MMIAMYHTVTPHLGKGFGRNSTVKALANVQTKSISLGLIEDIKVLESSLDDSSSLL